VIHQHSPSHILREKGVSAVLGKLIFLVPLFQGEKKKGGKTGEASRRERAVNAVAESGDFVKLGGEEEGEEPGPRPCWRMRGGLQTEQNQRTGFTTKADSNGRRAPGCFFAKVRSVRGLQRREKVRWRRSERVLLNLICETSTRILQ